MTARIGLLGGTFDPVHIGHLRAALEVKEQLALDEVRLLPSARPPHREQPQASAQQRLQLCQLAVKGVPGLSVDDRELRRATPSYTVDTLLELRDELGAAAQLFWLVGEDALAGLPTWHRWQELFELAHWVVLKRPDQAQAWSVELAAELARRSCSADQLHGPAGFVVFLQQPALMVSATDIRKRLAQGRSVRFLLADAVDEQIRAQHLYSA